MATTTQMEWLDAQKKPGNTRISSTSARVCNGWHNLHASWFRCGIDAAFFARENKTGVGIILQGENGDYVTAKVIMLPGLMRVEEGEAMGVYEALSWIKQLGVELVEFVSDSKLVVDAISSHDENSSEFGAIIDGCRLLLQASPNFLIKHVIRDSNAIAHRLAIMSKKFPCTYVWDESPAFVEEDLLYAPCVC